MSKRTPRSKSDTWSIGNKPPVGRDHLVHKVGISQTPVTDVERALAARYLHRHQAERELAEMLGVTAMYDELVEQVA
jgi:hypothetical protein